MPDLIRPSQASCSHQDHLREINLPSCWKQACRDLLPAERMHSLGRQAVGNQRKRVLKVLGPRDLLPSQHSRPAAKPEAVRLRRID